MGFTPELITVVVDGQGLQGWQGVHVTRSAEAAAIAFSLQASNPAWSDQARLVRRGKLVELFTTPLSGENAFGQFSEKQSDLLCTGYVDDYEVEAALSTHEVGISGRSKAGDAIDCPPAKHKTGREENKTLAEVGNAFDEFGIGFYTDLKLDKIPEVQIVPGQPLFVTLEREARRLGVLLTGQPDGRVKITRAGKNRHAGALVYGQPPCERWKLSLSIKNKRSPIIVRGQRSLGTSREDLRQEETAEDKSVGRYRPYVLFHEGDSPSKELKRRAQWEQLRRSGSGISINLRVATWRDAAGKLWEPGNLVAVLWEDEEVDQDLAIKTVTFSQTAGEGESAGTYADLVLADPRTLGSTSAGGGSGSGAGNGGGEESDDFDPGPALGDEASEGAEDQP